MTSRAEPSRVQVCAIRTRHGKMRRHRPRCRLASVARRRAEPAPVFNRKPSHGVRIALLFAVVLLDTTKEDSLDWTRYPFGPQSATPGVSFSISPCASRALKTKKAGRYVIRTLEVFEGADKEGHARRCLDVKNASIGAGRSYGFGRLFFLGLMQFGEREKSLSTTGPPAPGPTWSRSPCVRD